MLVAFLESKMVKVKLENQKITVLNDCHIGDVSIWAYNTLLEAGDTVSTIHITNSTPAIVSEEYGCNLQSKQIDVTHEPINDIRGFIESFVEGKELGKAAADNRIICQSNCFFVPYGRSNLQVYEVQTLSELIILDLLQSCHRDGTAMTLAICPQCKRLFLKTNKRKFCSDACRQQFVQEKYKTSPTYAAYRSMLHHINRKINGTEKTAKAPGSHNPFLRKAYEKWKRKARFRADEVSEELEGKTLSQEEFVVIREEFKAELRDIWTTVCATTIG